MSTLPACRLNGTTRLTRIAPAIEQKIIENRDRYKSILVGYGDCGSGGRLDKVLDDYNVERLPGAHCYSFFTGEKQFSQLAQDELGTFYLTDYLAANFDRLILQDLGINQHPELAQMYFSNYTKLVYLSQQHDKDLLARAQAAAARLELKFEHIHTGLEPLANSLHAIKVSVQ